jgi:hypothetical protein
MTRFSILFGLAIVTAAAAPSSAQTCQGYTPFSVGTFRGNGDLTLGDHVTGYGASLAFGQSIPGLFGDVAVAGSKFDGVDQTAKGFGLAGGVSVPVKTMPGLEFCPVADFAHTSGPNLPQLDESSNVFSIGGALGRTLAATPTLNIVPFADLRLVHSRVSVNGNGASDNSGVLGLGAGFVFSKTMTLRPVVLIPIAETGASSAFAISLGFNFGGK